MKWNKIPVKDNVYLKQCSLFSHHYFFFQISTSALFVHWPFALLLLISRGQELGWSVYRVRRQATPPVHNILCKSFANKNCLHFSANKIVRKQTDANNANNFSKHIGIKVEIFWVKLLNFQWNQLQKTIIWPKIIIGKFICIKWYQKMRMAKVKEFTRNSQV